MRVWWLLAACFFVSQGARGLESIDPSPLAAYTRYGTCVGDGATRGEAFAEARSRVPVGAVVYNRQFVGGAKYWWFKLWWKKKA
tara:strand:- start:297 stop:548 length:252 start_codon:yes stop_codon:yes gene_type:complete